jgi:hypothetical protein
MHFILASSNISTVEYGYSTLDILLAWIQAECVFHPFLKVCVLVQNEHDQLRVQSILRSAYVSVRIASKSRGLSVAEDVILVVDSHCSVAADAVLAPIRGSLYRPRIFGLHD